MKLDYKTIAFIVALFATRVMAEWVAPDAGTLASHGVSCPGETFWQTKQTKTWWDKGEHCPATCDLTSTVTDATGVHKVIKCSPESERSRGLRVEYRP